MNRTAERAFLYLLSVILCCACISEKSGIGIERSVFGNLSLPEGYRSPTEEETALVLRDSHLYRYTRIQGDFDGDELADIVVLAVDPEREALDVLILWAKDRCKECSWERITSLAFTALKYTGIEKVPPGTVEYYSVISRAKTESIVLQNDAIRCFDLEGASSILYWDRESERFNRIWTSD